MPSVGIGGKGGLASLVPQELRAEDAGDSTPGVLLVGKPAMLFEIVASQMYELSAAERVALVQALRERFGRA